MKRKKELLVILSSLLVIVLSVSVAYFTTKILGTGKEISVESADLKVIFTSGSGTINGTNIEPGWTSGENTFTVKNESNGTYKYNIIIKDLVNTFVTEGFLQYKITSSDGGYTMADFADVPKSNTATDTILAENISIEKGKTHTYNIIINYNNSEGVDQSADMGKTLTGKIFITKGTEQLFYGGTLAEALMFYNPTIKTRTSFDDVFTETNTGTLYKSTESITGNAPIDVYYFAGNAKNNWVKFGKNIDGADLYWRIIRTNHDSSIRLLYVGTSHDTTDGYVDVSFNELDEGKNPKYVGYMYGDTDDTLEEARTNTNDSTIKAYIDNWYNFNLIDYTKYLSTSAVYCNDRNLGTDQTYSTNSLFSFGSLYRLDLETSGTTINPSYNCSDIRDAFSVDNTSAQLDYPIALMTADEMAFAGGVAYQTMNTPYAWFINNSVGTKVSTNFWTMTPHTWDNEQATIWSWNGDSITSYGTFVLGSVRPAISLKSCTLYSTGDGSASDPYTIKETTSGC